MNQEINFQKSFNNHVRTLVAREEVAIGLMHLWDFVSALEQNPLDVRVSGCRLI